MQKARRHGAMHRSDRLWAHGFRVSFTPLPGCFSPFPHGTRSLSVSKECLALADGPACFTQGFTCPALLRVPLCQVSRYAYGAVTLCGGPFQALRLPQPSNVAALQPPRGLDRAGLGWSPFARRYSGSRLLVFSSCRY